MREIRSRPTTTRKKSIRRHEDNRLAASDTRGLRNERRRLWPEHFSLAEGIILMPGNRLEAAEDRRTAGISRNPRLSARKRCECWANGISQLRNELRDAGISVRRAEGCSSWEICCTMLGFSSVGPVLGIKRAYVVARSRATRSVSLKWRGE